MLYLVKLLDNQISLSEYDSDEKTFIKIKKNGEIWQEYTSGFLEWFIDKVKYENEEISFAIISNGKEFNIDGRIKLSKNNELEQDTTILKEILKEKKENTDNCELFFKPNWENQKIAVSKKIAEKVLNEKKDTVVLFSKKVTLYLSKSTKYLYHHINIKKLFVPFFILYTSISKTFHNIKKNKTLESNRIKDTFDEVFLTVELFFQDNIIFMKDNYYYYKKYNLCLYIDDVFIEKARGDETISDFIEKIIEEFRYSIEGSEKIVLELLKNNFKNTSLKENILVLSVLWLDSSKHILKLDEKILKNTEKNLLRLIRKDLYKLWSIQKLLTLFNYFSDKIDDDRSIFNKSKHLKRNSFKNKIQQILENRYKKISTENFYLKDFELTTLLFMILKSKKLQYSSKKLTLKEHFSLSLKYGCILRMIEDENYLKLNKYMQSS
jgi:hypothetical protein